MRKNIKKKSRKILANKMIFAIILFLSVVGVYRVSRIFAAPSPVKSVEIFSEKADFSEKKAGSWKLTKSAKWVSKGVVEVNLNLETVRMAKSRYTDVILVLDLSGSMDGTVNEQRTLYKQVVNNHLNKKAYEYDYETDDLGGAHDVYRYSSYSDVNNVLFANYCWKMVRTTDTGGVKLLYNGVPSSDGSCVNSGQNSMLTAEQMGITSNQILFNEQYNSPVDVGYMLNNDKRYELYSKRMINYSDYFFNIRSMGDSKKYNYFYADTYEYQNSRYYLNDATSYSWIDNYDNLVGKYTCLSTYNTTVCESLYYVFYANEDTIMSIYLSNGEGLETSGKELTITLGESILDNEDGTVSLSDSTEISLVDWYKNYERYNHYYTCGNVSTTCDAPEMRYIVNTALDRYEYVPSNANYKYSKEFTWDGNQYTLTNSIEVYDWENDYSNAFDYYYTCLNNTGKCEKLKLITSIDNYLYLTYFELDNGKDVEDAINEMFNAADINNIDSSIKKAIDYWYFNNMTDYTKYLEDIVWCNDRSMKLNANSFHHLSFNGNSICKRKNDRFTVSEANGNGRLTYPVGLLTKEEFGSSYWTITPNTLNNDGAFVYPSYSDNVKYGVRPAISLRPGTKLLEGDGTVNNPYVIDTETHSEIKEFNIIYDKNDNYTVSLSKAPDGKTVNISSTKPDYKVTSFKMNGKKIEGDNFIMPNKNVAITDVKLDKAFVIESLHYEPYGGDVKEAYFSGVETLKLFVDCDAYEGERHWDSDYIVLYDSEDNIVGDYVGMGINVDVPGDHLKVDFVVHRGNDEGEYYGYKVTIIPVYPKDSYSVTIQGDSEVSVSNVNPYFKERVELKSLKENFVVSSFKMNGTLIDGESFEMPNEDVVITDVVLQNGVESDHYPYAANLRDEKELRYEGATSLTVDLDYQMMVDEDS